jgi:iron complex transport system substrate-binding protein
VLAGVTLAGCSSRDDPGGSTPTSTDAPELDAGTEGEGAYEACLNPTGCVSFETEPETWISYQYGYGDIGIALGKGDGYLATNRPENYPDYFYDEVPGLAFDAGSLVDINGGDIELFYDLDPDLLLMDPYNAAGRFRWTVDDVEKLEENVAPFFGHFNRRYGYRFHDEVDYERLTLLNTFEAVATLFDERDRYDAIAGMHKELEATVTDRLPPAEERPEIALMGGGSDPEAGEFALLSALGDGYETRQYRTLGVEDAISETDASPWYTTDYEGLLELDPDAIVVHWTIQLSESEFDARFRDPLGDHPVGSELTAVDAGRIYRGGTAEQGPIINLFQTELAARQLYPDRFDGDENLFERERLGDAVQG